MDIQIHLLLILVKIKVIASPITRENNIHRSRINFKYINFLFEINNNIIMNIKRLAITCLLPLTFLVLIASCVLSDPSLTGDHITQSTSTQKRAATGSLLSSFSSLSSSSSSSSSPLSKPNSRDFHQDDRSTPSLFARILRPASPPVGIVTNTSQSVPNNPKSLSNLTGNGIDDDEPEDDEDDEDGDEDDDEELDEEGEDEELETDPKAIQAIERGVKVGQDGKVLTDVFGNKIKVENNRTVLVGQNKARDLGLLTIKAIILGPLIGLTLKAALIRGLFWAVTAYATHLFFPSLLSSLGLGTGLVGFARQLQPDYGQMLMPHLINIQHSLPHSFGRLAGQYRQILMPVIESIRSIPEGHCRFRAVCESATYLIRNAQSMSTSLQRISATVYLNFGTDYSKAWLDGIVQSDCAAKYSQCAISPFSMVATRLAQAIGARGPQTPSPLAP